MAISWTAQRTQTLIELWGCGLSAGLIAKRIGISRGAVAGKRADLGLAPRTAEQTRAAQAANGRRTTLLLAPEPKPQAAKLAQRAAVTLAGWAPLPGSHPKPLEARSWAECAFPVMGAGATTLSCCEPVTSGRGWSGYCATHAAVVSGGLTEKLNVRSAVAADRRPISMSEQDDGEPEF